MSSPFAWHLPYDNPPTDMLQKLVADGWSGTEIGQFFGISRNAAIGKIYRMRLKLKNSRGGAQEVHKLKSRSKDKRKPWLNAPRDAEAIELPDDQPENPLTLLELRDDHCRWPCQGAGISAIFCGGAAIERLPYCARHCRMAYTLPQERMTRAQFEQRAKQLAANYKAGKAA